MTEPLKDVYVTCDYGVPGDWAAGHHTGVDYRAAVGTPVYATHRGTVISVGTFSWGEAYGLHVVVRSLDRRGRTVHTGYCHLSKALVWTGQLVRAGTQIGLTGDSGRTFGAHLHYEERLPPWLYGNEDRPARFPGWGPLLEARLRKLRGKPRALHPKARKIRG